MKNNIHHINVNRLTPKQRHVIDMTTEKMERITYEEIINLLKNIPEVHHSIIEGAVQNRDFKLLGISISMALFQLTEKEIKKAIYT